MKTLIISRANLEIARAQLRRPLLTIGRSPTCDVVLRAPGVKPVHFLVEWIGPGRFDPSIGAWSVIDIAGKRREDGSEGLVLSTDPVVVTGFVFACIKDKLDSKEVIGGKIQENLLKISNAHSTEVLELVQVRVDSGAIENVVHRMVPKRKRKERLLSQIPQFTLNWSGQEAAPLLRVLLQEMPGAEIYNRGQRIHVVPSELSVSQGDMLQIRWRGRDFFVRFVPKVKAPPIPRDPVGDPLMKKTLIFGILLAVVVGLMSQMRSEKSPVSEKRDIRVATVEIKETAPAPVPTPVAKPPAPTPRPQPLPPRSEKPPTLVARKKITPPPKPKEIPAGLTLPKSKSPDIPASAGAPRFKTTPGKERMGLNSPATNPTPAVTDVNQVGILGALKSTGPAGKGVQADQIINEGIVTDALSGQEESRIVLQNPATGTIGVGKTGGTPRTEGQGLASAATTLSGAGKYDPSAIGPIARKGGESGYTVGTDIGGNKGVGSPGLGTLDGGEFSVEGGGLDRETVRRVIASYRGQIRTCYEKSLLSSPQLAGRIVYLWTISPEGPVISSERKSSTLNSDQLEACVLSVIRSMIFPNASNGKSTKVIYPFVFQSKN